MTRGPNVVEKRTNPDETRKRQNKLNKDRAKRMESAISIIFLGNTRGRVAYSGAGSEKGDNKIPLPNNSGHLMIECKTSSLRHKKYGAKVPIKYIWLHIIEKNRLAMGSRLGILAIHFHDTTGYYTFFRQEDIPILESISGNTGYTFGGKIIDGRFKKNGKPNVATNIYRQEIVDGLKESTGTVPNIRLETAYGTYICTSVEDFKMLAGF